MAKGEKVSKQEVQAADKRFVQKVKANKNDDTVFATAIHLFLQPRNSLKILEY